MSQGSARATLLTPRGTALSPSLSLFGRQNVGQDTILFSDSLNLEGTGVRRPHAFRWGAGGNAVPQIVVAGYAIGSCSLNSGQVNGGTWLLETLECFQSSPGRGLYARFNFMGNSSPNADHTTEVGFGNPSGGTVAPDAGAFFRWGTDSTLKAVTSYASGVAEVPSAAITNPSLNVWHLGEIYMYVDRAVFWIDGAIVADMSTAAANGAMLRDNVNSPFYVRNYLPVADAANSAIGINSVEIRALDTYSNRSWEHFIAGNQDHSAIWVSDQSQAANWVNSTAAAPATLSNTAAGYSSPWGPFAFNMIAGADTDYALFAKQMPTGKQLYICGVSISAVVNGALGANAARLEWALGVNGSAVSLATADSAAFNGNSRATRRVPLGCQGFLASAASGTTAEPINARFDPPIVCQPSANNINAATRFIHIILRIPVGTATGTIRGLVSVNGYWDN